MTADRRRPKGEGSVYERKDGTWVASLDLPKTLDGKRRRVVRECKNEKHAHVTLRELRKAAEGGNLTSPNVQLSVVVAAYLDTGLSADIRGITRAGYHAAMKDYVLPKLGSRKLSDITPALVVRWRDALASEGFSHGTIRAANQQLGAAFEWARLRGIASTNPVRDAGNVTQGAAKKATVRLDGDQARAYLAAAKGDPDEVLVLLLLGLGVRRSELLGFRWSDLDAEGTLRIARAVVEYQDAGRTVMEVGPPKTEQSARELPLPPYILEALDRHRIRQQSDRERAGLAWTDSGYIIANEVGQLMYPSNATTRFTKFRKRHELPFVSLRNLRHSCAALMLESGVRLEAVSQQLGHADIGITKDIYAGTVKRLSVEARDTYASFLLS